jgi:predicted Zn-ribbon and HTH transcriptional regulator
MSKVLKCPMCGDLYEFYAHMVGDQSVCPKCRQKAKDNMRGRWTRQIDVSMIAH